MSEMIERAARAIAEALGDKLDMVPVDKREWLEERGMFGEVFRDINAPFRSDYEDAARAVLQAIREPSEAMVDAAWDEASIGDNGGLERAPVRDEYRSMIAEKFDRDLSTRLTGTQLHNLAGVLAAHRRAALEEAAKLAEEYNRWSYVQFSDGEWQPGSPYDRGQQNAAQAITTDIRALIDKEPT